MFERFTERARQVVVLAQDESQQLGHPFIGTEHILLGLLREEEGIAARVLERLGIELEEVRVEVERIVGREEPTMIGQIPFTPRAKRTLELALREGISLGHNFIGTEHILLGLAREPDGVAAQILLDLGADPEKIRGEVLGMLAGSEPPSFAASPPDDVELTSPPLAPELLAELERLGSEKQAALDRQSFEEAASLRDAERRLRVAAARLVRVWRGIREDT